MLVLQGDRDAFGTAALVGAEAAEAAGTSGEHATATERIRVVEVAGADHGLTALKGSALTARGVADLVVESTAAFVLGLVDQGRRGPAPLT